MNDFNIPNKRQLRILAFKNKWRFRIEKLKIKLMDKKSEIVLKAIQDIEKEGFVKLINEKYFQTLSEMHCEFMGMRTIYCLIDENTYNKYKIMCLKYDEACKTRIEKISFIKRLLFNIKPETNSNLIDRYGSVPLIVVKGLIKPEFKFVAVGNNINLDKKNDIDIPEVTFSFSEKKNRDYIKEISIPKETV